MRDNLLKCVVVGAGRIALSHLPHIVSHSKTQLVGIVEPNFFMRFVMKRLLNVPVYKSVNLLTDKNFDAVFILTPPNSHYSLCLDFLKRRKHVFLEKPLTLDPNHSESIMQLAKENNVHFTCGYVYRFHPIFKQLQNLINSDLYGTPISCSISMVGNVVNSDSPKSWRSTGVGSGCLYDYGCHAIDLGIFLFGQPSSVSCVSKDELFQDDVIDKFTAKLNYSDTEYFETSIHCNWADETVRKAGLSVKITTDNHVINSDGQSIIISGIHDERYSIKDLNTDVSYYLRGEEFQLQLDTFVDNSLSGNLDYSDVMDAVKCDQIISEIYKVNL